MTSSLLVRQEALLGKGSALNTKGQSVAGRGRKQALPTVRDLRAGDTGKDGTEQ